MKRLLITSIAATLIVGGSVLFMNKKVTEPVIKDDSSQYIVMSENNKPVEITVEEIAQPVVSQPEIIEKPIVTVIKPSDSVVIKNYEQLMLENFIKQPQIYIFINKYLKVQYADKFSDENLQSTITYLVDYFAINKNIDMSNIKQTFTW